jgi:hypothetical protein
MSSPGYTPAAILSAIVLILAAGCLLPTEDYPKFLSTKYEYSLVLQNHGPLSNVTVYIPLPVKNGMPMIGNRSIVPGDFERDGFSIAFTRSPPGWNPGDFEKKEYASLPGEPWFVGIHADSWPNDTYRVEIRDNTINLQSPGLFAQTLYPAGNESLILPKYSFSPPGPIREPKAYPGSDLIRYADTSVNQHTWVYADLPGDHGFYPGTLSSISIFLLIHAGNQWLDDYDTYEQNYYEDYFSDSVIAPSRGGHFIAGHFKAGEGVYPDFSTAKWQQFMGRYQLNGEKD